MAQNSIFWVVDYIKKHRGKETRYGLDTYLLRQGYDAGTIDDAWKIVRLEDHKDKKPSFLQFLLPLIIISNISGWYAMFVPWQSEAERINHPPIYNEFYQTAYEWSVNPTFLLVSMAVWTILNVMVLSNRNARGYKTLLIGSLVCNALCLFLDLIIIFMAFNRMGWQGPVSLTVSLVVGLVCTILQLKYLPRKIEVRLSV